MKITYIHIHKRTPRYIGEGKPGREKVLSRGAIYGKFLRAHPGEHICILQLSKHSDKVGSVLQEQGFISWLGLKLTGQGSLLNSVSYSSDTDIPAPWTDELKALHKRKLECPHCGASGDHRMMLRYHFDNCGKHETVTCPHCDKIGEPRAMRRWHFDRCPLNPEAIPRVQTKNNHQVQCPHCEKWGGNAQMHRYHFDKCGQKRDDLTCPHCGKTGAIEGMLIWHFDNCKHKP